MRRASDPRFARVCIFLALFASIAFRALGDQGEARAAAPKPVALELVQTTPVETELGLDGLRDTAAVWIEMLDGARERIDLEHFYAVDEAPPTRLTPARLWLS